MPHLNRSNTILVGPARLTPPTKRILNDYSDFIITFSDRTRAFYDNLAVDIWTNINKGSHFQ